MRPIDAIADSAEKLLGQPSPLLRLSYLAPGRLSYVHLTGALDHGEPLHPEQARLAYETLLKVARR